MNTILDEIMPLTEEVDTFGFQLQQNLVMLAGIAKAAEFNAAEIKDCKVKLQNHGSGIVNFKEGKCGIIGKSPIIGMIQAPLESQNMRDKKKKKVKIPGRW